TTVNQNVVTTGAITATANTNSRSVRPLEIRLVNNAIIGPYPMNQAKKNTVQPPSQASSPRKVFNETNSLTNNPSASKKLLKINIAEHRIKTPIRNPIAKITLKLIKYNRPRRSQIKAEKAAPATKITIIVIYRFNDSSIPVNVLTP